MVTLSTEPVLALQPAYGYVLVVLFITVVVHNMYMSHGVGQARKKYGVKYPAMYAPEGDANGKPFNCVQRGHQNSLELVPSMLAMLIITGLRFPITAAIAGLVYNVGRILYFQGYSSGDPAKRTRGAPFYAFGMITFFGMALRWAFELLTHAK